MDSSSVIESSALSKKYRLGTIGMTSLREDLSRWWNKRSRDATALDFSKEMVVENSRMINDSEFWALHNLDFKIQKGEIVGIIGSNGSGKSTLLKILSRITEPSTGQVQVRGKVAALLEVGTGFHPELTGKENIYINGAILGMTRKEVKQKFDEIVDFAGIDDFIETPIKRYSSGMTVRLGFAVAAHLDPDILIVDEVLAVGDAAFQKKCLDKMEGISKSGKTILFVSHNMASIETICSKGICLKEGIITEIGSIHSTIKNYLEDVTPKRKCKIKDRTDRVGSGELVLEKVSFRDKQGSEINLCRTGSFLAIDCVFKTIQFTNKKLVFCVSISNSTGQSVSQFCTNFVNFEIIPKKSFTLCLKIEKLNLQPGIYTINTYLEGDGEPMDWIINAFELIIENGDFYGSGLLLREGQGNVLLPFSVYQKTKSN